MQEFSNDKNNLALSKFEKMLKSNKVLFFDSEEFEDIIYYYLDNGKINLAKKAIALGLSQHPVSSRLQILKVEVLILENKDKEAEKLLLFLEKNVPEYDEVYIQKAAIFSKNNLHDKAIDQLKIALKYTDDLVDVNHLLGMENLFIENFPEAKLHFKTCLELNPEDFSALYNVVYCYEINEEYNEVIQFLNAFIDDNPFNEFDWHQLGLQYKNNQQFNQAVRAFDYAILIDEYFTGAYFEKAKVLQTLGEYDEAIKNYFNTLKLDDPSAVVFVHIATCYKALKNNAMAIKYFLEAVDEDPLLDYAWLTTTELLIAEQEYDKALYYIKKALDTDEDNIDYLNRLAEINVHLNLFEEAIEALKKSIDYGEISLVVYLMYADLLHFIGEYKQAIKILFKAAKIHDDNAAIFYRLSGLFFMDKKDNEGYFYLKNALKMQPEKVQIFKDLFYYYYNREDIQQLIQFYN
jgi:tetratricopeptide (TPR) repeat protein